MATYTWTGGNGRAFDDAGDWSPNGIPSNADTASLVANSGLLSGSGSVASLAFQGNWTINDGRNQLISADTAFIDGAVDVDGSGRLAVNGDLTLARFLASNLTASNGGFVAVMGGGTTYLGTATLIATTRSTMSLGNVYVGTAGASATASVDAAVMALTGAMLLGAGSAGSGTLLVQDGGQAVIAGSGDGTVPYLQLGAVAGSSGTAQVSGANSVLLVASSAGVVGLGGSGTLNVVGGASARFNSSNNGINPSLVIGQNAGSTGTVGVGGGSTLAVTGSVIVGEGGSGTLRVVGGSKATSSAYTDAQAALSVGAGAGGGTLVIDGGGSSFITAGAAVVGGDNRGGGLGARGVGQVVVTGGGLLQTGSMTILPNSVVTLDGSSQEAVGGSLTNYGLVSSFGTLSVSGVLAGSGTLRIGSGLTSLGGLSSSNVQFTGPSGALRVMSLTGTSTVTGLQIGDVVDLVGTSASLSGTTVTTATGALSLGAPPAGHQYALASDGNGGTFVTIDADTVAVYRFFDSNYGTHFFSASASEKDSIIASRPDLVYEGVGLQSIDPASNDPNAAPVYRFFDSTYGTHFFTASASERDTVIASRADLLYEGVGFTEHTAQQVGDVAVYRFFDSNYGTHFYTADANEKNSISATRADLIYEGIGFYAPSA